MQLLIKHKIDGSLTLPISYHHVLQGIIYNAMRRGNGYSKYIHNSGNGFRIENFKFFTYGLLHGPYSIIDHSITFKNEVFFEIRSPDIYMIKMIADSIHENGIRYGNSHFSDVEVLISDYTVESNELIIRMAVPLTTHITSKENGSIFLDPNQEEFYYYINRNFIKKYTSCYGVVPDSPISLKPLDDKSFKKDVTKFKEISIKGWFGDFILKGERKYLDFLYQTGLGEKNSQGFGMFDII